MFLFVKLVNGYSCPCGMNDGEDGCLGLCLFPALFYNNKCIMTPFCCEFNEWSSCPADYLFASWGFCYCRYRRRRDYQVTSNDGLD